MAITFVKTSMRFVYTKDDNPAMNIIIARISTYETTIKDTDIILDMSGKDLTIRMSNKEDRDAALVKINAEF